MLPAKRDLFDPLKVFIYNIGASSKKPVLSQFSYIEKFEYWALIWGSFVMTLTGALLLMHNLAMAYLPLWAIEVSRVVHYLEAVLACLAILIWHGYWVALDPDVYPLNWAWLTGETYVHDGEDTDDKGH
jgi:cytochrome b subunit of formate dehydrogenase